MEEDSIEAKCENMMNIVVESRKRYGKMCVDYHQKALLVENKLLNLQLETFSNYRFKSKGTLSDMCIEDMDADINKFALEIEAQRKNIDGVRKKVKNTLDVVLQLRKDAVCKKMAEPLTAEAKLARAKEKQVEKMDTTEIH